MTASEYAIEALKTKTYRYNIWLEKPLGSDQYLQVPWIYPALKLAGEAGEVTEKLGKIIRDKDGRINSEDRIELLKELGDVLWYVNALATDFESSLDEVMQINLAKLADRRNRNVLSGSGDNR